MDELQSNSQSADYEQINDNRDSIHEYGVCLPIICNNDINRNDDIILPFNVNSPINRNDDVNPPIIRNDVVNPPIIRNDDNPPSNNNHNHNPQNHNQQGSFNIDENFAENCRRIVFICLATLVIVAGISLILVWQRTSVFSQQSGFLTNTNIQSQY